MSGKRTLRVMHIVRSLEVGGLENGVVNLLNQLSDDPFRHVVCCLSHAGKLAERIRSKEIVIVEMGLKMDRFRFPVLGLKQVIRRWSPDVLHTRGWGTIDGIFAARAAGISRVIHGEHGREASDPEGRNVKRNLIRRILSPLVDRFVTVSDDLKGWLTETVGIAERKVLRIHNGVDVTRFANQGRAEARRMLGLNGQDFIIGTIGRLDPVKDHNSLLHAFASMAHGTDPVKLVIAGDGPMRSAIKAQTQELGIADKVLLLGERHDVPLVLQAFDLFALTSIAEGISNTILEAMATGLPVVATRVGGSPELVEHGISGQLVAARDVTGLSAAIESYMRDPRLCAAHGRGARARAEQKFSLERMASQYAQLYQGLTGAREDQAA